MTTADAPTRRLFFALWPEPALQARLAASARRCSPRPVASDNLHMTLVFLGACDETSMQCFANAATAVTGEPFEMQLDYLGGWPRRGIQWLGCSSIPPALPALVQGLENALLPCGLKPDKRPFVPHVTLSRRSKKPQIGMASDGIHWPVREFVLVESRQQPEGVRYIVLRRWPLQPAVMEPSV